MSFVTRGFSGRRRGRDPRLPPGQTLVDDWPVLSAGRTPRIDTADWAFTITTEDGTVHRWSGDELNAVRVEDITTDIHRRRRGRDPRAAGAFFVWTPPTSGPVAEASEPRPVQLVAGGSGVVPLLAMARAHTDAGDATPFRLLYSVRTPGRVFSAPSWSRRVLTASGSTSSTRARRPTTGRASRGG